MNKQEMEIVKEICDFASDKKLLLNKNALEILCKRDDWKFIIQEAAKAGKFCITPEVIEEFTTRREFPKPEKKIQTLEKKSVKGFKILSELNFTEKKCSSHTTADFVRFFREKFITLKSILEERKTLNPKPIKVAKKMRNSKQIDIIGMVYRKWETRSGHIAIELEDLEDRCIVIFTKDSSMHREAKKIMVDDVIGVRCSRASNGEIFIGNEFYWPELPVRSPKLTKKDVFIASISDMHVGSKLFYEDEFRKFIAWLSSDDELSSKIDYLFITGDNVDGIGIYPGQYKELAIKSVKQQYREFSELILEIPEKIDIFIIPGQHDAVRWADPQPALPEELVPELYDAKNIHLLSSPGWVEIEGVKIMMYHGSCYHDVFTSVSGLSYEKPQEAVLELLKRRDFMAGYGLKHPFVPEDKDYMVLKEIPDIVLSGDIHHIGYAHYRGTTIINNSTWQGRTEYQVKLGHIPTPGIVVVMNLKDRSLYERRFLSEEHAGV